MADFRREGGPRIRGRVRDDVERDDDFEEEGPAVGRREIQAPRLRRGARGPERADRGEGESVRTLVREIPSFVKLLLRLARDPRVSRVDKGIVLAAVAYVAAPIDIIPDVPFIGQVDDVVLIALAINRLLNNAGVDVLLDHWDGDVATLERALELLDRADSYLPAPIRTLLGKRRG